MENKLFYHQALVCEYGHLISGDCSTLANSPTPYCPQCGKPCISTCPSCGAPIRGDCYKRLPIYRRSCSSSFWDDSSACHTREPEGFKGNTIAQCVVPSYCHACGSPYPWTESLIHEAENLVDLMDELTPEQKSALKECFPSLISDMPTTSRHSLIAAKILQSASTIAKTALQNLLAEHVTAFALSLLGWKS